MNFQKIPPVDTSKTLLDIAFSKAREKGKSKKLTGNWLQIIRQKEGLKLDIIKDNIVTKLDNILKIFPYVNALPPFYPKLMELTLDLPEFKKSLGAINWANKKIRIFHKSYVSKISKTKDKTDIKDLSKQFYGRISSILKQIDPQLKYLEYCRKIMKTYPDIKEMFSVCIYGFPNVGKTTFFNKIANTKAKTAAYAFTTKTINTGSIKLNDQEIQFLDVPGTLARRDKLNKIELQAELVLKELAQLIIYVFDLSGQGGYSIEEQEQLFQKLTTEISKNKIIIYISKQDITEQKIISTFKHKHYSLEDIKEKILQMIEKQEIEKQEIEKNIITEE